MSDMVMNLGAGHTATFKSGDVLVKAPRKFQILSVTMVGGVNREKSLRTYYIHRLNTEPEVYYVSQRKNADPILERLRAHTTVEATRLAKEKGYAME